MNKAWSSIKQKGGKSGKEKEKERKEENATSSNLCLWRDKLVCVRIFNTVFSLFDLCICRAAKPGTMFKAGRYSGKKISALRRSRRRQLCAFLKDRPELKFGTRSTLIRVKRSSPRTDCYVSRRILQKEIRFNFPISIFSKMKTSAEFELILSPTCIYIYTDTSIRMLRCVCGVKN